ncbi:hypothetical protein FQN60_006753 [Etheostoma spectabile]|uniref:Uncharacterized protein n=1 Tax=Etheostoma spectabile TaxID=54343 RepID=A0A5J5CHP5_9PERO|nr:hypothetical protein FQN60_006753 [Etheostoma spectabile]
MRPLSWLEASRALRQVLGGSVSFGLTVSQVAESMAEFEATVNNMKFPARIGSLCAHRFPQSRGQVRGHLTPRCRV